jgi:hypothetical protein
MSGDPLGGALAAVLAEFVSRGDLAHLALFVWAAVASLFALVLFRETTAASRRFDEFIRELANFNRRHSGGT